MKSSGVVQRGLIACLVSLFLFGPSVALLGVALLLAPADNAYCLNQIPAAVAFIGQPPAEPSDGAVAIPETAGVVWPLPGTETEVVQGFDPPGHTGVDLAASEGTPILVIADGLVREVDALEDGSLHVAVEHTVKAATLVSVYDGIGPGSVRVGAGEWVVAGQYLGAVGQPSTPAGNLLRLQIRPGGASRDPVDPVAWLDAHDAIRLPAPAFGGRSCGASIGIPGSPVPYDGPPGGRVPDPTGTGGFVTAATAHLIAQTRAAFPDSRWACWAPRPGTRSQHPHGRACDVTFGNRIGVFPTPAQVAEGWRMTLWLQQNATALNVEYLIWQGLIWSVARDSEGWRPYNGGGMHNPTTPTGGHYDHLHITVKAN